MFVLSDTEYVEVSQSDRLPGLDLALLARLIDVKPMTRAVQEYRAALRTAPG